MDQVNHSIKCNVTTCDYHAGRQNYCTLNGIQVGCCDCTEPQNCDCTQCSSFCKYTPPLFSDQNLFRHPAGTLRG